MAWSGSGFVARFFGTGLSATCRDGGNVYTIIVDGAEPRVLTLKPGRFAYQFASQLPCDVHTVEVYRRTEPMLGPTSFGPLQVEGQQPNAHRDSHAYDDLGDHEPFAGPCLLPVQTRPRRMELIGDSISCGYGNEGLHAEAEYSADTENHYLSYGALLARAIDAQLSTIAWSGRGVVRNYDDQPGHLVPELYQRTLPEEDDMWRFADPQDLVVVNLGTNDFAVEPGPDQAQFIRGYIELLGAIRQHRVRAPILTTIGPMLSPDARRRAETCIEQAVQARQRSGDGQVSFYRLLTPNAQPGANEHPSVLTHARMADELLPVIRQLLY